jgi:hypothetical protein
MSFPAPDGSTDKAVHESGVSSVEPKILYIECDLADDQTLDGWRHRRDDRHGHWSARRTFRRLAQRIGR